MIDDPCVGVKLKECYLQWHDPQLPCDSPQNIVAAQIAMKHNGLYDGELDGDWGQLSQLAYEKTLEKGLDSPFGECRGDIPVWNPAQPKPPTPTPEPVSSETESPTAPIIAAGVVGAVLGALLVYWSRR